MPLGKIPIGRTYSQTKMSSSEVPEGNIRAGTWSDRGAESGILLVDKPSGITSHGVVSRARKALGTRKVGHAGTLDPAATGLLILGVNRGTKLLHFLSGLDKNYVATIRLGATTVTDDAEGDIVTDVGSDWIPVPRIESAMAALRGDIMQAPSAVSAIKINGQRAHKLVRAGAEVTIPERPVTIERFELIGEPVEVDGYLELDVEVECSSGTYVRAIARDMGESLGVGGHVTHLRRTAIGPWTVDKACSVDSALSSGAFYPAGDVCRILYPSAGITEKECDLFRYGVGPECRVRGAEDGDVLALECPDGTTAGLGELKAGRLRPVFIIDPV